MSGKTPGSPRHPSSRHPLPSEKRRLTTYGKRFFDAGTFPVHDSKKPALGTWNWRSNQRWLFGSRYKLENYCTLILRGRVSSIFRFSVVSEDLKLKGGQRLEALATAKICPGAEGKGQSPLRSSWKFSGLSGRRSDNLFGAISLSYTIPIGNNSCACLFFLSQKWIWNSMHIHIRENVIGPSMRIRYTYVPPLLGKYLLPDLTVQKLDV